MKFILSALFLFFFAGCDSSVKKTNAAQILRLNLFTEPPSLDPRKATDSTSFNVILNLFEGLMRIGDDHQPHPAVAKSVEISEDKRVYTFTLRTACWTNGDPVTAYDFLFAWQSLLEPKFPSPYAYKLYVIQNADQIKSGKLPLDALGVDAIDAHTLKITLKHPTPYFLELTALPTFYPVNAHIAANNPDWAADAGGEFVTNGPFTLQVWEHENELIATKNPHYWDAQSVYLDALHFAMIDDTTTELYMYEMDELDWAGSPLSNLPHEYLAASQKEFPFLCYPTLGIYYYILNTEHYPIKNPDIRRALAYATNRQEIVEHLMQAGQQPALALIPPLAGRKASLCFEDGSAQLAKHFFEKGLKSLGITQKEFPKLTLLYNTNKEHQTIAQAIQHQWKETLGVETGLEHCDWKVYLSRIDHQDFQIARMGWLGDYHDPLSFLEPFNTHDWGNSWTGWKNEEYIALLESAKKEANLSKREELLRKAEEIIITEMPVIPIFYIVNCYLKKPYLNGVYLSELGLIDFKRAWIGEP